MAKTKFITLEAKNVRCTIVTILIAIGSFLVTEKTFADTYVNGYYRKNGTYVQPHYRSDANNTAFDNWSTRGNINPYTGVHGTRNIYNGHTYKIYDNSNSGNNGLLDDTSF